MAIVAKSKSRRKQEYNNPAKELTENGLYSVISP